MMNNYLRSMGPAIGNHLWQSTAFVAVVWLLTLLLRKNQARTRHTLWVVASVKFLLPFSLLITLGNFLPRLRHVAAPAVYSGIDFAGEPFSEIVPLPSFDVSSVPTLQERLAAEVPVLLASLWLCGAAVILLVWYLRWRELSSVLRRSKHADGGREVELLRCSEQVVAVRRPIPLRLSDELIEPGIFGIFRPVLLWPQRLSERLDDDHIEAILGHELMHVRRRDNLTASLHMMVEAAFWFHPLVWWMERRMVEERERACDEAVVQMGGRPEAYAESLLKACRFCVESPLTCVSGITGADLSKRVRAIMTEYAMRRLTLGKKMLLVVSGVGALVVPVLLGRGQAERRMPRTDRVSAPMPLRAAARAMVAEEAMPAIAELTQVARVQEKAAPSPAAVGRPETEASFEVGSPSAPSGQATVTGTSNPNRTKARLSFEVAAIKPLNVALHEGALSYRNDSYPGLEIGGSVYVLIERAYGLHEDQIIGGPSWSKDDLFDIVAKPSAPADPQQINAMLRTLLEERFKLAVHTETREGEEYSLVAAKGGARMKPADDDGLRGSSSGPMMLRGTMSTAEIASLLSTILGKPVLDHSGLTGAYKVDLRWGDDQTNGPSVFTAIQEQLGLKLEPMRGPVKVLVIDHVERPSEN